MLVILHQNLISSKRVKVVGYFRFRVLNIKGRVELNDERGTTPNLRLDVSLDGAHSFPIFVVGSLEKSIHKACVVNDLHGTVCVPYQSHVFVEDAFVIGRTPICLFPQPAFPKALPMKVFV